MNELVHRDKTSDFVISIGSMLGLAAILGVLTWWLGTICYGLIEAASQVGGGRAAGNAIFFAGGGALFCGASTMALIGFAIKFTYARYCTRPPEEMEHSTVRPAFPPPRAPRR